MQAERTGRPEGRERTTRQDGTNQPVPPTQVFHRGQFPGVSVFKVFNLGVVSYKYLETGFCSLLFKLVVEIAVYRSNKDKFNAPSIRERSVFSNGWPWNFIS
jgi:hypothetical protein